MDESDRLRFGALITDALAYWRQDVSTFTLGVWWNACQQYSLEQVSKAISAHATDADRGRFPPLVADIVRALDGTSTDRSLMAWGMVLGAMRDVGMYRSVVFDSSAIHAAIVDLGGWSTICAGTADELPHLQRRFCEAFRAYSARGAATWPPVLIGLSEADNRLRNRPVSPPAMVGYLEGCRRVLAGPERAPAIAAAAVRAIESGVPA